jgi:2'-5' RNA ligase superfamily protein
MSADSGLVPVFVVLEPDAALGSLIQGFKDQARSLAGDQLYLADPPHLTVYLAVFASTDALLERWPQVSARALDLSVNLVGWHVFEADAMTGGQTLVCNIAARDKDRLRKLQREIVELLAPLRDPPATRARYAPRMEFLSPDQRQCVDRYGFPFVGDGWEPHFTIASIHPTNWPAVWQALEPQAPHGAYRCARWRLWWLVDGKPAALDGLGDL